MLPSGAPAFVPRDSCHTTEPLRRSCIPALGLLPLCPGAGSPQGSCPGLLPPECEGAGAPEEWAPVPAQQEVKVAGGEAPRTGLGPPASVPRTHREVRRGPKAGRPHHPPQSTWGGGKQEDPVPCQCVALHHCPTQQAWELPSLQGTERLNLCPLAATGSGSDPQPGGLPWVC